MSPSGLLFSATLRIIPQDDIIHSHLSQLALQHIERIRDLIHNSSILNSKMTYWVYILKCSDNSYYTGVTNNLERRISEHELGEDIKAYTYKRRPVKLVYYEEFNEILDAIDAEKQIKGWRREKKEALIKDQYEKLPELSKRYKKYQRKMPH